MDPEEVAAKDGLVCVYPGVNELLLDLDDPGAEVLMREGVAILEHHGASVVVTRVSPSRGGNKHAWVTVDLGDLTGLATPITPL